MESSPLINYLENIRPHAEILKSYEIVRKWLQESGMTSKEIESIKTAPHYIWIEHEKIHSMVEKIKSDLRRYGILDDTNEEIFGNFIVSELKKISRKYPLVDEL